MSARSLGFTASLVLLVSTVALASPAQADWERERRCQTDTSVNTRHKAIDVKTECATTSQPARSSGENRQAHSSSNYDKSRAVYSRHVSGCYPDQLQNLDFGDCQRQQEVFCGDEATWVQEVRVRQENPDEPIEYGSRFCAGDGGAGADGSQERPAITMQDLAKVAPSKIDIHLQNGGRGMRDAHTNIYADAEQILERKTQFGQLTLMRLTPIEFRWDYGDGTTRITTDPGQDIAEFNTETSTSHIYEDTGTYAVGLSTVFIGEVSYDNGETWELVPGQLVIDSDPAQADIFRSVTRNVAEDCVSNPSGWGCGAPGSEPTD